MSASKPDFHYYLITDRKACAPRTLPEVVEEACRAGVRAVQLREKDLADKSFCEMGHRLREVTGRYNARLFINGRPDVAKTVGADGVHCPEKGLPPREVRRHWPSLSVGVSVHSPKAVRRAEKEGADFLLFGPVFFTASKAEYGKPQGLDRLKRVAEITDLPVFAVGGITPQNAGKCLKSGAFGVAGISAVMKAEDIAGKVEGFRSRLNEL